MVVASAPTYVATQEALTAFTPFGLVAVRFLAAALCLGAVFLVRRRPLQARLRHLPRLAALAVLGYAGYGLLLNLGQTGVSAGTTSLLLNSSPIFALLLGMVLLRERVRWVGLVGMGIATLGVLVVTIGGSSSLGFNWHALFIVAAAFVLAVFLVVQQPLFHEIGAVEVVFWGCLIGGLVSLPFVGLGGVPMRSVGPLAWFSLAILVVVCTCFAYGFWNAALSSTSVTQGSSLLYVIPTLSLLLGWWLFRAVPSPLTIVGGVLAVVGVVVMTLPRDPVTRAGDHREGDKGLVVDEELDAVDLSAQQRFALESAVSRLAEETRGELITVSLWRPADRTLVRLVSSLPAVYRVGGISRDLGDEWFQQCVRELRSYQVDGSASLETDSFEHHDVLRSLGLGAAINSVVAADGQFLGCVNVLARPDRLPPDALQVTDDCARVLAPLLRELLAVAEVPDPAQGSRRSRNPARSSSSREAESSPSIAP